MGGTWLDRNRNTVFAVIVSIAAMGIVFFYFSRPKPEPINLTAPTMTPTLEATSTPTPPIPTETPTPAPVRVYITGAILNSDVYYLAQRSIIKDVIEAAGGFAPDADREKINLALELKDQQQIHVPHIGEEDPLPPIQDGPAIDSTPTEDGDNQNTAIGGSTPATEGKINLNTASLDQLDTLPGIGPVIAQRIIDYRESSGGFTTIEDITQVSGIGKATFAKIKDLIVVE